MLTIFGDLRSGNCLKVKYTADLLKLPYRWIDVDIMTGGTRTPEFLALNPAGQVPVVKLADGRALAQSNAVVLYLADGTHLLPKEPYERAKVHELLFWEQYSHEPYIAVCRFQMVYLGQTQNDLDPEKVERGYRALDVMETRLDNHDYFVGDRLTLADICLVAYSRVAHEGGFDLSSYPNIRRWIASVEADLVEA
jgi:glutathione S-transferase